MIDHSKEAAIRARAYQLWVESGYADGYQDQHWRQAEREVAERAAAARPEPGEGAADKAKTPPRHTDGVSLHPSVIETRPGR